MPMRNNDIIIQVANNAGLIDIDLSQMKRMIKGVCARFGVTKATISIAIVDDAAISKISEQFLNCKSATDVISFDLSDDGETKSGQGRQMPRVFELVINSQKAVREAKLRKHGSEAELALYVLHGLLHNLGFDDAKAGDAKKMHDTEDEILQQFDYGIVYSNR